MLPPRFVGGFSNIGAHEAPKRLVVAAAKHFDVGRTGQGCHSPYVAQRGVAPRLAVLQIYLKASDSGSELLHLFMSQRKKHGIRI
jgi:hypothetical protein